MLSNLIMLPLVAFVAVPIDPRGVLSNGMDSSIVASATFLGGVMKRGFLLAAGAVTIGCWCVLLISVLTVEHILVSGGRDIFLNMLLGGGLRGSLEDFDTSVEEAEEAGLFSVALPSIILLCERGAVVGDCLGIFLKISALRGGSCLASVSTTDDMLSSPAGSLLHLETIDCGRG